MIRKPTWIDAYKSANPQKERDMEKQTKKPIMSVPRFSVPELKANKRYAEPFYMVYAEGKNTPAYKHKDLESAQKEAQRLRNKLGCDCWVLESKDVVKEIGVEEIHPPKVYWFKQPASSEEAEVLMWNLINKYNRGPFADVPQNIPLGALVFNNGNKICTVNDIPLTFADVLKMFGTELKVFDLPF